MEQINKMLTDETVYPDEKLLKSVLGRAYGVYLKLLELLDKNEITYEWRYYMDGKAWLFKAQKKKKTIIWMSVRQGGYLQAGIYIPSKYEDGLYKLDIDKELKQKIKTATKMMKSTPCVFEIKNQKVLKDLNTVMQYKLTLK